MADDLHPADGALRFISVFAESQDVMAATFRRFMEMKSPEVGRFVNRRLRRLSDDERVAAMTSLAADARASEQWAQTPGVIASLKEMRDTLSHANMSGAVTQPDGSLRVFAFRASQTVHYAADDFVLPYLNAMWVIEQVLYVSSLAGVHSLSGEPYRRDSGATLLATPPSPEPRQLSGDFVVLYERTPDGGVSVVVPRP
jgi:hypothetical protein